MTTLDDALHEVVRIITGEDVGPRPGQRDLAHDIAQAMETQGRVSAVGPTGVGKTQAILIPAMLRSVEAGERTVVSTESLALQSQILDKDAPDAAQAIENLTGHRPEFAVHKGFSNHVCYMAAHSAASEITPLQTPAINTTISDSAQQATAREAIQEAYSAVQGTSRLGNVTVDGNTYKFKDYRNLLLWALSSDGDKSHYTDKMPDRAWGTVSMTPQECPGAKGCPFASVCLPKQARTKAKNADVVITNHALLGIQAANSTPVVLGNRSLGNFHHLVVDEAHGLPGIVRNGGAVDVGVGRVKNAVKAAASVIDSPGGDDAVAALEFALDELNVSDPVEFDDEAHGNVVLALAAVQQWASETATLIPEFDSNAPAFLRLIRVRSRLEKLADDCSVADSKDPGVARWFEKTYYGVAFRASPVDVSSLIVGNLFQAKRVPDEYDPYPTDTYPLSVSMLSATLPTSFRADSGIGVPTKDYPSPFDDAYGDSMCYCPKLSDPSVVATQRGKRWKFDVNKHAEWASERIVELATLNGGSALVLSANKVNGERYARALRTTGLTVYSQWDGEDPRVLVDRWRSDIGAVMVGTRSLMTGVDAKGDTCSLVIIDRVPRAAGNVVDDARVKSIMERLDIDRWSADRYVYVSDAALLLEQAFGRLIRTVNDSGMAVCLDPRIVPGSPLSYSRDVSGVYLNAMRRFKVRRSSWESATEFLENRESS